MQWRKFERVKHIAMDLLRTPFAPEQVMEILDALAFNGADARTDDREESLAQILAGFTMFRG